MKERHVVSVDEEAIQAVYRQSALQPSEIRVLKLQPAFDHMTAMDCTFDIVHLDRETSSYIAVSYCWGPPVEGWQLHDQVIKLCGVEINIRGNLGDALRRFRLPRGERRLWVDALCINQADDDERTQQVAAMAQIYAKAAGTLVWLGEDSEELDGAIFIAACKAIDINGPSFASMAAEDRKLWTMQQHQALDPILRTLLHQKDADLHNSEKFNGLEYQISSAAVIFTRRRYFTRRWILQELFNSRSAIVHCGAHSIELEKLLKGCKRLPIQTQRPARIDPGMDMVQVGAYLEYLEDLGDHERSASLDTYASPILDLMWCLKYFGQSQCSDSRDKIYALLGFSGGVNILQPDYTISSDQVWMKVGLALIDGECTGLLITTAAEQHYQGYKRAAGIPSWLPDFSAPVNLLPRDYPTGSKASIDEHDCLSITMLCLGKVKYHNGWPICTGMPEHMLSRVSSLPPGGWDQSPHGYWDSHFFGVPLLKSNKNELRAGDLVCEVPNWEPRSFLLHIRPHNRAEFSQESIIGSIVGIAPVTSNGECLVGELMTFRIQ